MSGPDVVNIGPQCGLGRTRLVMRLSPGNNHEPADDLLNGKFICKFHHAAGMALMYEYV
jgi:hypothetical protein